ncbi:MAG: DUF177 domain-containing protein [Chitinophagales bacterium]|nr:DUF177 domain-containing protein [Chitinophagales bacterium]MDW8428032.1 YceD family protein [Chitinophagales bacterium]
MHGLRDYDIAFVGLPQGVSHFDFRITKAFFDQFPNSIIENADVRVHMDFEKQPSFFLLKFHMSGTIEQHCYRCHALLEMPVSFERQVVVKFEADVEDDEDDGDADVIYIRRSDTHLSVAQHIYDFLTLCLLEYRASCDQLPEPRACDPEVLARLHTAEPVRADARWAELKNIKIH